MTAFKSSGYAIHFGDIQKSLGSFLRKNRFTSVFIVCDGNTLTHCLPLLVAKCPSAAEAEVIEVEPGEQSKDLAVSAMIWQTFLENASDRHTLIINLGGGVVSDLGGFCAALYKRGIAFVNIPTSLLAMADASVGAKTGINFGGLKNSIGTFSDPEAVFIDPDFLRTLPERHVKNGLAEIYKIALVSDAAFWKKIKKETPLSQLIHQSVKLKQKIVKKDPRDKGYRNILNFGHTIGHALESVALEAGYDLLHGEAVVLGMITEAHISLQKKFITRSDFNDITTVLFSKFTPVLNMSFELDTLMKFIRNDKKSSSAIPEFALLQGIGKCAYGIRVSKAQISKALATHLTTIK
jgi:3-dehydroquinate synthase